MKKNEFLESIIDKSPIEELVDSDLSLIGTDDEVTNPSDVASNSTTDSHVSSVTQQNGKNRTNAQLGFLDLANTLIEEIKLDAYVNEITDTIIKEANSSLEGKEYKLPLNVIQFLQQKNNERARAIVNHPHQTYEQVKKLKHDIEASKLEGDWSIVLNWTNTILERDRNTVDNQKRTTMEIGMENRFRKTHNKGNNTNVQPISVNENVSNKVKINEDQENLLKNLISESQDFSIYKANALRIMLKEKIELFNKTKEEIKAIKVILNKPQISTQPETEINENKNKK